MFSHYRKTTGDHNSTFIDSKGKSHDNKNAAQLNTCYTDGTIKMFFIFFFFQVKFFCSLINNLARYETVSKDCSLNVICSTKR
jgi:hypothetical protein